jgi:hypothetical protein
MVRAYGSKGVFLTNPLCRVPCGDSGGAKIAALSFQLSIPSSAAKKNEKKFPSLHFQPIFFHYVV